MCGITGLVAPRQPAAIREEAIRVACDRLRHRGPDDDGVTSIGPATLGMRRLAIFDPAQGHQPMRSPDGRFTVVFNGAIFNFRELRAELAATGWAFRTQCDTEVLLAAYARWGDAATERLRGMFAFAVWDAHDESLHLARDPFGIKPLYFRHDGQQFAFASEIRALLAAGLARAELDPGAVADYLAWLAVPAPQTIYRGVFSLRPGECATLRENRLTRRRPQHASWHAGTAAVCRTRGEFTRELRARLEDTIRAHSLADVPVGAFLSGGLDSAAIVGLMRATSGTPLQTFAIGFDEAGYSEAAEAEATARHFGTAHHTHIVTGPSVAGRIEAILDAFDQPSGDGLNTFFASETARAGGVKVALSGLGGDELFGGYPSFRDTPRLHRWLPLWRTMPAPARDAITRRLARGDTRQRKLADVLRHARDVHEIASLQRRLFSETSRAALLSPDASAASGGPFHPELSAMRDEFPSTGRLETVSAWELRTYAADVLLRDSDVMSMHHSLELRVPFIDRQFIAWLWAQPSEFKFGGGHPKAALFEAVRDVLPPGFATRPKRGFTLPFPVWMSRELKPFLDDTFTSASIGRSGLFARESVQQLWRRFLVGHDSREWSRVWSLAVLISFANRRGAASAVIRPALTLDPGQLRTSSPLAGRTLLLAPEIFASEGGIPRILQLYLRALGELSVEPKGVRLLALNDAEIDPASVRRSGTGELGAAHGCARNKLRFIRAAVALGRDCDRIVCGHVAQLPIAWLAQRLNPRLRYYLVAHGIEVWRPFTAAERLALRGAERVFCVSDYTRRELLRHCPLPPARAVVVPNAVDPRLAPGVPPTPAPSTPLILTVTRLSAADRYKGVEHLIAAMPRIAAEIPGARLRIVGRGDDAGRLRDLAAQLGLGTAVEFAGFVPDDELVGEFRRCRLFALPSRKEGFGLVYLEAMAQGRPCLGARAGGVPEVICPAAGVLAEYGDVAAIAAAAIAALRRDWDFAAIRAHADSFSYPVFRDRLSSLLAA